jgi:hypothetical protein
VVVSPDEVAFVVNLASGQQARFSGPQDLEKNRINAGIQEVRYENRQLQIGDWQLVPLQTIYKVSRVPVRREWTSSDKTGTSEKDDSILLNTRDGVRIKLNLTIEGEVQDADAAKYVYFRRPTVDPKNGHIVGQGEVAAFMDQNVRGFVQTALTTEAGQRTKDEFIRDLPAIIIPAVRKTVAEQAKAYGLTISAFGYAGYQFEDPEVQHAANRVQMAELGIKEAENKVKAAKILQDSRGALQLQQSLDTAKMNAEARLEMAKNSKVTTYVDGGRTATVLPPNQ